MMHTKNKGVWFKKGGGVGGRRERFLTEVEPGEHEKKERLLSAPCPARASALTGCSGEVVTA